MEPSDNHGLDAGEVELQSLLPGSKGTEDGPRAELSSPPLGSHDEPDVKIVEEGISKIQLKAMMRRQILIKV